MVNFEIKEKLKFFGLSDAEAKVYYSALALEEATVDKIARSADTNRTSTYPVLEKLEKFGLISKYKKKKKTIFKAAPPEKFLEILEEKKNIMEKIIPDLKTLFEIQEGKPSVRFYEGREGLKTVLNSILKEADEVFIFGDGDSFKKAIPGWTEYYSVKRAVKNIRAKIIVKATPANIKAARELRFSENQKSKLTKIRLLPEAYPLAYSGFDVYNHKVVFYSFDKHNIAVVLENKHISRMMKIVYELLWNEAGRYEDMFFKR